jgi:predicted RNA binding protein YcfA (HicA-like mRNA interferase family)
LLQILGLQHLFILIYGTTAKLSLRNHGYRDVLKVLNRRGFRVARQRGSHIILIHEDGRYVTVPRHSKIKEPTLKSVLDQAGISKEEFLDEL